MSNDKVQRIKELCAPIIQENMERYAQYFQGIVEDMETAGLLKQLPQDARSFDEFDAAGENNQELIASMEALDKGEEFHFNYMINTNGDKLDKVKYNESSDSIFFISQGRLVSTDNLIDCRKLVQKDSSEDVALETNQEIMAYNKHGFNLDLLPEPVYSDNEIAESFEDVDFVSSAYSCETLANAYFLSGAVSAHEYCPQA